MQSKRKSDHDDEASFLETGQGNGGCPREPDHLRGGHGAGVPASTGVNALWSVDDVARWTKRSRRWIYGQISNPRPGSLPFFRLPGRAGLRFDPAEVREWLEQRCRPRRRLRELP
jgi:predicted DNA-binding transcriptional regulator AlpA